MSDPSAMERLPDGVDVMRTRSFEAAWLARALRRPNPAKGEVTSRANPLVRAIRTVIQAPLRVLYKILTFPDAKVGWSLPLLLHTWKIARKGTYPIILSSSPPHSSQLAPAILKGFIGFKWVADFRDGWSASVYGSKRRPIELRLRRILERFVLKRCDRVIANTASNKKALLATFSFLDDKKVTVITNGFDTNAPLKDIPIEKDDIDCDLMHVGSLYREVVDTLVSPLASIKKRRPDRLPRVFMYGQMPPRAFSRLREEGLDTHVSYKGWVSWDKSIHLLKKAPSLILLLPHTTGGSATVPSKLYGYLFAGTPVLLIGPSGDSADLIESSGAGMVIRDEAPDAIADGMVTFLQAVARGDFAGGADKDVLRPYTMQAVAAKLDRLLTELYSGPGTTGA